MLLRQTISEKLVSTLHGAKFDIRNTLFFNILSANSFLAIFYGDSLRHHDANSSILKDLETRSGISLIQTDPPKPSNVRTTERPRVEVSTKKILAPKIYSLRFHTERRHKVNGFLCASVTLW